MVRVIGLGALPKKVLTVLLLCNRSSLALTLFHFPGQPANNTKHPVAFPGQIYRKATSCFFNTTGGVSHVGIYLQNNKFIHASASQGVTISDLFDPYYLKRFIGAGRVDDKQASLTSN